VKSFADGKIDVYLGPVELGAADNLEQAIVDFIGGARKSLDIAVQEIDSIPIAEAIINARWKGVSINVFVEQDYIRTKLEKVPKPPEPDPASGETPAEAIYRLQWRSDQETADEDVERKRESLATNRVILSALLRNGIEVKGDFNPKIFHQKLAAIENAAHRTKVARGAVERCAQEFLGAPRRVRLSLQASSTAP
jgi:hypothetical protein